MRFLTTFEMTDETYKMTKKLEIRNVFNMIHIGHPTTNNQITN